MVFCLITSSCFCLVVQLHVFGVFCYFGLMGCHHGADTILYLLCGCHPQSHSLQAFKSSDKSGQTAVITLECYQLRAGASSRLSSPNLLTLDSLLSKHISPLQQCISRLREIIIIQIVIKFLFVAENSTHFLTYCFLKLVKNCKIF